MPKKGKEQKEHDHDAVAQVGYDDGRFLCAGHSTGRRDLVHTEGLRGGKNGKHRKSSKKGKRHSKSSKKSSSTSSTPTHSPSIEDDEEDRYGLFGSTSSTDFSLYFYFGKGYSHDCSVGNAKHSSGYTLDAVSCSYVYACTAYWYKVTVTVSGQTYSSANADYFNNGLTKRNAWVSDSGNYDGSIVDLPVKLNFALTMDISFGGYSMKDFRIGMGNYREYFIRRHNWWIGNPGCYISDPVGGSSHVLKCTDAIQFMRSPLYSPDEISGNAIKLFMN